MAAISTLLYHATSNGSYHECRMYSSFGTSLWPRLSNGTFQVSFKVNVPMPLSPMSRRTSEVRMGAITYFNPDPAISTLSIQDKHASRA